MITHITTEHLFEEYAIHGKDVVGVKKCLWCGSTAKVGGNYVKCKGCGSVLHGEDIIAVICAWNRANCSVEEMKAYLNHKEEL
jgi:hypothetical protein